jgi:hypothetical protein
MSAERDELRELVEQLPEDEVVTLLAQARHRVHPIAALPPWPPRFFGSFADERTDLGRNHEDLLADGFGRER